MLAIYFKLFWLPALISAGLFALMWLRSTPPRHAPLFGGWFAVAMLLQYFAPVGGAWVLGLLMQTALAIVLLLRYQLG